MRVVNHTMLCALALLIISGSSLVFAYDTVNTGEEITLEFGVNPVNISVANTGLVSTTTIHYSWTYDQKDMEPEKGSFNLDSGATRIIEPPLKTEKGGKIIWPKTLTISNNGPSSITVEKQVP